MYLRVDLRTLCLSTRRRIASTYLVIEIHLDELMRLTQTSNLWSRGFPEGRLTTVCLACRQAFVFESRFKLLCSSHVQSLTFGQGRKTRNGLPVRAFPCRKSSNKTGFNTPKLKRNPRIKILDIKPRPHTNQLHTLSSCWRLELMHFPPSSVSMMKDDVSSFFMFYPFRLGLMLREPS